MDIGQKWIKLTNQTKKLWNFLKLLEFLVTLMGFQNNPFIDNVPSS